jgi:hypothetical protein
MSAESRSHVGLSIKADQQKAVNDESVSQKEQSVIVGQLPADRFIADRFIAARSLAARFSS